MSITDRAVRVGSIGVHLLFWPVRLAVIGWGAVALWIDRPGARCAAATQSVLATRGAND